MNLSQAIQERILILCHERGVTIYSLASHCGIPSSTLQNIFLRDNATAQLSTIAKICDGLDMSLADFFVNDIFRNLKQG